MCFICWQFQNFSTFSDLCEEETTAYFRSYTSGLDEADALNQLNDSNDSLFTTQENEVGNEDYKDAFLENLVSQEDPNKNVLLPQDTFLDYDEPQTSCGSKLTRRRIESSDDGELGSSRLGSETIKRKKFIFKKKCLSKDESIQNQNNEDLLIKKAMCYDFKLKNLNESDDSD